MKAPRIISCLELSDDDESPFKENVNSDVPKKRGPGRPKKERSTKDQPLKSAAKARMARRPPPLDQRPKLEPEVPNVSKSPARQSYTAFTAEPLDLSTIQNDPLPPTCERPTPRLFDLEHCPVYHPTIEQFARPLEYIENVANKSKQYGILKVVPPKEWKPPFVLDTEKFRFNTRLQRLNSMEASSRANINFVEQLTVFHEQRNQTKSRVYLPTIANRPVDLWRLKREVNQLGGFQEVTTTRQWPWIARRLGYDLKQNPAHATQIKNAYCRIILPYEQYMAKLKTPQTSPKTPKTKNGAADMDESNESIFASPVSFERVQEASARLREVLNPSNGEGRNTEDNSSGRLTRAKACEICRLRGERGATVIVCDDCERGFHMECLVQFPKVKPRAEWICDECIITTGDDYGFEEGNEHSFKSFHQRAEKFKQKWLQLHPIRRLSNLNEKRQSAFQGNLPESTLESIDREIALATEDHYEREFWKAVESQSETVEVEYGADLHTTNCGSGLPDIERHPLDPYSRDGWNLNNMPILPGSLLRYIKTDISGMTVPWLYVGMMFSTFAWHKEDHYSYSINYQHMGETKTWYGVPSSDDKLLEEAVKKAAPELFEQQPDIMFQLVTLMSPGRLRRAGVKVYACDQRPREFVITLPKAYHTGFNHGFNVNEAVNFALPDWLSYGLECVQHYKNLNKHPVFSQDELLITIFQHERSPRTSKWLLPLFKEMVEREIMQRETARQTLNDLVEITDDESRPEDQDQCITCHTFCYLSQVISLDTTKSACVDHACDLEKGPMTLRKRFEDDELRAMLSRVHSRASKAGRLGPSLLGSNIDVEEGLDHRKSSRKRTPSLLALEAAGDENPVLSMRMKRSRTTDSESQNQNQRHSFRDSLKASELGDEEEENDDNVDSLGLSKSELNGLANFQVPSDFDTSELLAPNLTVNDGNESIINKEPLDNIRDSTPFSMPTSPPSQAV